MEKMSKIKAAITRFDNAAQNYAFKGSAHPDEWQDIENTYIKARERLERLIAETIAMTAAKGKADE